MGRGWQEIYLIGPSLDFTYLRRSEWICLAYFAYIPILSFIINVPASRRGVGLNKLLPSWKNTSTLFTRILA